MAKEFGDRGIRANAVSPGPIRTELGGGLNDESKRFSLVRQLLAASVSPTISVA
jgi:NAD(P)-dependent dehydrogenase (short-subunit alcohol dehydrogenase family)